MSRTMYATLGTFAELAQQGPYRLTEDNEATREVIITVNNCADLTNGPPGPHDVRQSYRVPVTARSLHHEEWPLMRRKMSGWTFRRKTRKRVGERYQPPSLKAWSANIVAFQRLWRRAQENKVRRLDLRQSSQDPVENFNCVVRQSCGDNNPTAVQFNAAFQTAVLNNAATFGRGKNCEDDGNILLSNIRCFLEAD